jgi:hypothetical protein
MSTPKAKEPGGWTARVSALFIQPIKLPGWAAILLFIYTAVPDNYSRFGFWADTAKAMGGYIAVAATVVASPFFGPTVLVFGLLWVLFVGEPSRGVQRHHWLRYVGWSIASICIAAVAITAVSGWFELKLRQVYAEGAAGIPRNTPGIGNPNRSQSPLFKGSYELTADQIRILLQEFPKLKTFIPAFYFSRMPGDYTSNQIFQQFQDALSRSGFASLQGLPQTPRDPQEEGLMIAVHDPNNIPLSAQKFREALEVADIHPQIIRVIDGTSPGIDFVFFVGPKPINWQ